MKALLPKRVLYKYEPGFRFLLYQFYKGTAFQCNICNKKLRKFIQTEGGDRLCPACGGLSRTRRLFHILNTGFLNKGISILDFSPSRCLYRILKNPPNIQYISSDLSGDFLSDFQYDITDIEVENDTYDLIICYHVLEHIANDSQAMKEMFRVLKKGGTCLIQTPFKEGDIYEDPAVIKEQEKLIHFGQRDHVRIYSAEGLKDRLVQCGFQVTIKHFTESESNTFGFKTQECVLICIK